MKKLTLKANVAVCAAFKPTTFSQSFRQNSSETFGHCPVLTFGWLEWSGGALVCGGGAGRPPKSIGPEKTPKPIKRPPWGVMSRDRPR